MTESNEEPLARRARRLAGGDIDRALDRADVPERAGGLNLERRALVDVGAAGAIENAEARVSERIRQ